jgi:hypothetical protein
VMLELVGDVAVGAVAVEECAEGVIAVAEGHGPKRKEVTEGGCRRADG